MANRFTLSLPENVVFLTYFLLNCENKGQLSLPKEQKKEKLEDDIHSFKTEHFDQFAISLLIKIKPPLPQILEKTNFRVFLENP